MIYSWKCIVVAGHGIGENAFVGRLSTHFKYAGVKIINKRGIPATTRGAATRARLHVYCHPMFITRVRAEIQRLVDSVVADIEVERIWSITTGIDGIFPTPQQDGGTHSK
jgi:hypothetical protein